MPIPPNFHKGFIQLAVWPGQRAVDVAVAAVRANLYARGGGELW